jgi:transcriptional regulator with XRE-family HTH domain
MTFHELQRRLLDRLRRRIRSGEVTERGLAKLSGISQPHLHNVLKGKRVLSVEMADEILHNLGLNVLDLVEPEELEAGRKQYSE